MIQWKYNEFEESVTPTPPKIRERKRSIRKAIKPTCGVKAEAC